ncbi:hypothetical protein V8U11_08030 [Pseudomonas chlororaphis]|uniref:hypothetical protein n=1 Tax=Pseudomonas chlororaphis TaxID=587753 RepID=UPI0030D10C2B
MSESHKLQRQLQELQSKAEHFLSTYLSSANLHVVRNTISKGALYNFRPFETQRSGFKLGKELKSLPKNVKNTHIYYFDGEGRVVFAEIYGKSESVINREFYFYEEGKLKSIYFNAAGSIRNIMLSLIEGDKIMRDVNYGKYGESISDYLYAGDRLDSIEVKQKEHDQKDWSSYQVLFEYLDGQLSKITNSFPNGYQEQRYP